MFKAGIISQLSIDLYEIQASWASLPFCFLQAQLYCSRLVTIAVHEMLQALLQIVQASLQDGMLSFFRMSLEILEETRVVHNVPVNQFPPLALLLIVAKLAWNPKIYPGSSQ